MRHAIAFAALVALAPPALAQSPAAEAEAALRAEPKVIDLVHQPGMPVEWIVGVRTDGTKRHGLAMAYCTILARHGAVTERTILRIVDFDAFMRSGGDARGTSLGSVRCATNERMDP